MIDAPAGTAEPLIDIHVHFLHARCGRKNWMAVNAARLRAGETMGISCHVSSILGSFGHNSPTYFPSPDDVQLGNDEMLALQGREGDRVRTYVVVNPNYTDHAVAEIERCAALGAIGLKLAASRRADDPLLDPVCVAAREHGFPVLHHIWQHRRRDWPSQEASDGVELGRLAARHPEVNFILAHIGGGGDYMHTNPAVRELPNVYLDISGSGVDRGMLDLALNAVGAQRMLFGTDLTMETGLAKLRALEVIGLDADAMRDIRWRNAARIFPMGSFPFLGNRESANWGSSTAVGRRP